MGTARALLIFACLAPGVLSGQARAPFRLGISVGTEWHSGWQFSNRGITLAGSVARAVAPQFDLQAHFAVSDRGRYENHDVTFSGGGAPEFVVPSTALVAGLDLVLHDTRKISGGYLLAGAGVVHFAGGEEDWSRTRGLLTIGLGGSVLIQGTSLFFLEARFSHVTGSDLGPRWLIPIRVGVQFGL